MLYLLLLMQFFDEVKLVLLYNVQTTNLIFVGKI